MITYNNIRHVCLAVYPLLTEAPLGSMTTIWNCGYYPSKFTSHVIKLQVKPKTT